MGNICKGICEKEPKGNRYMYRRGFGYCKVCNRQMNVNREEGINRCFCCGMMVRLKPENSMYHKHYDVPRID